MKTNRQTNDFIVLIYRFTLLLVFYTLLRLLFYAFNADFFSEINTASLLRILQGGLKFDISGLLYINLLYIVLYSLPLPASWKHSKAYQMSLKGLFISLNTIGIAANCIDIIYFRFIQRRTTYTILKSLENEDNMLKLWGQFLVDYWYVFLLFIAFIFALFKAYSWLKARALSPGKGAIYYIKSSAMLLLLGALSVVGMRGGYRHSTRPINMSNAGKYVNNPEEMAIVLNTPFSILRNWGKSSYNDYQFFDQKTLGNIYSPVHKGNKENTKKNVVVFILESWSREYIGAFNKTLDNGTYEGYTPFLDSLIEHSYTFGNAYANGKKSIDAMPSIIASIPALVLPYISSEYSSNQINSLASVLKKEGYTSSFFHGAQNGSMGFESFAKVAGFDHYYGKIEYNNDKDYDGMWGIWDEPYFTYFAKEMSELQAPFYTTLFSLSSHHPYKLPEGYEGRYPKGNLPIHQCLGYTDNALRQFFKVAQQQPWYNNTLFVFTADHSAQSTHSEYKTTKNRFAVPLVFYAPNDSTLQGWSDDLAQQIDIMPSILDYVGTKQSYVAFGQNLFQENKRKFVVNYTNDTYQVLCDNYAVYFRDNAIINVFDYEKDPKLAHALKQEQWPDSIMDLTKAIVQQYNNRIINNTLTIE